VDTSMEVLRGNGPRIAGFLSHLDDRGSVVFFTAIAGRMEPSRSCTVAVIVSDGSSQIPALKTWKVDASLIWAGRPGAAATVNEGLSAESCTPHTGYVGKGGNVVFNFTRVTTLSKLTTKGAKGEK